MPWSESLLNLGLTVFMVLTFGQLGAFSRVLIFTLNEYSRMANIHTEGKKCLLRSEPRSRRLIIPGFCQRYLCVRGPAEALGGSLDRSYSISLVRISQNLRFRKALELIDYTFVVDYSRICLLTHECIISPHNQESTVPATKPDIALHIMSVYYTA